MAATMKVRVAMMESFAPIPMPQTPWPLVHPPPTRVPIPTNIPAMMMVRGVATSVYWVAAGMI